MSDERMSARDAAALIVAYYAKPGNGAGGACHVVLDDSNLDDGSLDFCRRHCLLVEDVDGEALMRAMLQQTRTQRRKALALAKRDIYAAQDAGRNYR